MGGRVSATWDDEDPSVAVVTISNARIANALDASMLSDIERIARDLSEARAVVVTGDGERHFCSGADINAWGPMSPDEFAADWVSRGNVAFDSLGNLPALVVAAINGTCYGGGLELALRADVRYCSSSARFAFPETGIGAVPGWCGGPLLAAVAGRSIAAEVVMGGRVLDAPMAKEVGLVSEVFDLEALMSSSLEIARNAAKRSAIANSTAKRLLRGTDNLAENHAREGALCKGSPDGKEGLDSFKEKREPDFHPR